MSQVNHCQRIIAIDPGTSKSAVVVMASLQEITYFSEIPNELLLAMLRDMHAVFLHAKFLNEIVELTSMTLVIEMINNMGMVVGLEVLETCVWIGRFMEAFQGHGECDRIFRDEVKMHLCNSIRKVDDKVIRQRLIDIYGGKEKAIGKKTKKINAPGPLHGISGHCWQALAVGVTYLQKREDVAHHYDEIGD